VCAPSEQLLRDLTTIFHQTFIREVVTWRQLQHPYILPFYGIFPDVKNESDYLMVSPLMPKTLAEYIAPGENASAPVYCPADDRIRLVSDNTFTIVLLRS
jgi:serine/threonine protein kinase